MTAPEGEVRLSFANIMVSGMLLCMVALFALGPATAFLVEYSFGVDTALTNVNGFGAVASVLLSAVAVTLVMMSISFRGALGIFILFSVALSLLVLHGALVAVDQIRAIMHSWLLVIPVLVVVGLSLTPYAVLRFRGAAWAVAAGGASTALLIPLSIAAPDILTADEWTYLIPGFKNIRNVGMIASLGGAAALGLSYSGSFGSRLTAIGLAFFCALVASWSGSRTGVIGILAALITLSVLFSSRWRASLLCAVTVAMALFASLAFDPMSDAFGVISRIFAVAAGSDPSSSRIALWMAILDHIIDHPFLGNGYLQVGAINDARILVDTAHNFILEFMLAWGLVVGGLMAIAMLGIMVAALVRSMSLGPRSAPFAAIIVAAGCCSLLDNAMVATVTRLAFFVSVGVLLSPIVNSTSLPRYPSGPILSWFSK